MNRNSNKLKKITSSKQYQHFVPNQMAFLVTKIYRLLRVRSKVIVIKYYFVKSIILQILFSEYFPKIYADMKWELILIIIVFRGVPGS